MTPTFRWYIAEKSILTIPVNLSSKVGKALFKFVKSPFNYIGGKYRLLDQIMPLLPTDVETFVDMFSGGGNVGINATSRKVVFNDANSRINDVFRYFQKTPTEKVLSEIDETIKFYNLSKTNAKGYYALRDHYNQNPSPIELYVLSAFGYNYQIRFNKSGGFNNPFGKDKHGLSDSMRNNLVEFCRKLDEVDATFSDHNFIDFPTDDLIPRDFVYLDPPYLVTSGEYNRSTAFFDKWGERQELTLLELLSDLTSKKIPFALSNVTEHKGARNESLLRYLEKHPNLTVHEIASKYSNSSYNTRREGSREVLVSNYRLLPNGTAIVE